MDRSTYRNLGKEILNHLCRLVRTCSVFKDGVVYEEGMIGSEFYFILDGEVEVTVNDERLGFLGKAAFFGEAPLIELVTGKGAVVIDGLIGQGAGWLPACLSHTVQYHAVPLHARSSSTKRLRLSSQP